MWEFVNIGYIMMGIMIAILLMALIVIKESKSLGAILFLALKSVIVPS